MGTIVVNEGVQPQLTNEEINWSGTYTGATAVSAVTVIVYLNNVDVTATVMPVNAPTVSGSRVNLSPLKALTAAQTYRVVILATVDGQPKRALIFDVKVEDPKSI